MFYARIAGRDMPIESGKVSLDAFTAPQFTVTVPAVYLEDIDDLINTDIEIFQDGESYLTGYIFDTPELQLSKSSGFNAALSCLGDLGRLTCYRAKSDANYDGVPYSLILQDLLQTTDDAWVFVDRMINYAYDINGTPGNTLDDTIEPRSDFSELEFALTIDLRDKDSLWAQVAEIMKIVSPEVYITYGGVNPVTGWYELVNDYRFTTVGSLLDHRTESLIQGDNLTSLKLNRNTVKPYVLVEAYGQMEPGKTITLEHAEDNTDTTGHTEYATYPIMEVGDTWCVEDQTPGKVGCATVVEFPEITTTDDSFPASDQAKRAGFSLWKKTVQFIKEHNSGKSYSVSGYLQRAPQLDDSIYLQSEVYEPVYDPISQRIVEHKLIYSVADWHYVTKVSFDFSAAKKPGLGEGFDGYAYKYDLELSENRIPVNIPNELALFKRLKKKDRKKDEVYLVKLTPGTANPLEEATIVTASQDITVTSPTTPPMGFSTVGFRFQLIYDAPLGGQIDSSDAEIIVLAKPSTSGIEAEVELRILNASIAGTLVVDFLYV